MSDAIQAIGRALSADIEGINAVSHNVANINTPGFRSVRTVPDFNNVLGVKNAVHQSDGALAQTGRGFDLALRGPGFFVVESNGHPLLVRSGSFSRSADGYLVDTQGRHVMTEGGAVEIPDGTLRVAEDGSLEIDGRAMGRLLVVGVEEPARLVPAAGGFRYEGGYRDWMGSVQQGALEQSNVDAADQTLRLIELTRHAESMQRAYSIYDKVMDVGINRIGDN